MKLNIAMYYLRDIPKRFGILSDKSTNFYFKSKTVYTKELVENPEVDAQFSLFFECL